MRFLASSCVFITLLGTITGHHILRFGRFPGQPSNFPGSQTSNFPGSQTANFPTSPLTSGGGITNVNSPTPTGPRGCFCLPPNQQCDPNGVIPRGSTRISAIKTRIVNVAPESRCPQEQIECCFGSDIGTNPLPPINSPIVGCGGRISLFPGRSGTAEADFGEYPWMTAILGLDNSYISGGVLIHPSWVLTAAHKVVQPGQLKIRVGDYDLAAANEVPQYPHQERAVVQVIFHPQFNIANLHNDVALLRLQTPVNINKHVNVACLPERGQVFSGQRCFVSGWGQNIDGSFQAVLKEVDLPIVEGFDCEARFRRTKLGSSFELNQDSFICAGGEAGKDACAGDGGSPLVCDEGRGVHTVVGLVAWGIGCGQDGIPGAYVNIPNLATFIKNHIQGNQG